MYILSHANEKKALFIHSGAFLRYMEIQGVAVLLAGTLILLVLALKRWRVVKKKR
jgi:hypothetical protein